LLFPATYRRGVPGAGMLQCCQDTTRKARARFGAELRDFHGQHDHVHLLADDRPKVAISALVNSLKGGPARQPRSGFTGQVNRHIMHGHLWSPSCFATSRGGAPPGIIRHYIKQQRRPVNDIKQQRRPVNATSGLTPPRRTGPVPGHYGHGSFWARSMLRLRPRNSAMTLEPRRPEATSSANIAQAGPARPAARWDMATSPPVTRR
jgi:putative transposase